MYFSGLDKSGCTDADSPGPHSRQRRFQFPLQLKNMDGQCRIIPFFIIFIGFQKFFQNIFPYRAEKFLHDLLLPVEQGELFQIFRHGIFHSVQPFFRYLFVLFYYNIFYLAQIIAFCRQICFKSLHALRQYCILLLHALLRQAGTLQRFNNHGFFSIRFHLP